MVAMQFECFALACILRELLPEFGNVCTGWRPVRIACIAVEQQVIGFQPFFEFFLTECNCLVVIVRTNNFEIHTLAHEPPAARALRRYARSISLVIFDGSASLLPFHKSLSWRI